MSRKTELLKVLNEFYSEYDFACEISRDKFLKTLAPGASVPQYGKLHTEEDRARFNQKAEEYRSKVKAIFDGARADEKKRFAATPSGEAANAIAVISARDKLTENEVSALMERFSDNPMTLSTIADIARKKGVKLVQGYHLDERLDAIDQTEHNVNAALSLEGLKGGKMYHWMLENDINDNFVD